MHHQRLEVLDELVTIFQLVLVLLGLRDNISFPLVSSLQAAFSPLLIALFQSCRELHCLAKVVMDAILRVFCPRREET